MLVLAFINIDIYPFLRFSDLTFHLEDIRIGAIWVHLAATC